MLQRLHEFFGTHLWIIFKGLGAKPLGLAKWLISQCAKGVTPNSEIFFTETTHDIIIFTFQWGGTSQLVSPSGRRCFTPRFTFSSQASNGTDSSTCR